jgi:hypothetical protein
MPPHLYLASVPVFRDYLGRVARLAEAAGSPLLARARLGDAPPSDRLFATAAAIALQGACPLVGRAVPDLPAALAPRLAVARALLGAMQPADFADADRRRVVDPSGTGDLSAAEHLFRHALPGFFYHIALGHAALLAAGLPQSAAELDGPPTDRPSQSD